MEQSCPECGAAVAVADDVMSEEVLECPECAVELQVISRDPLTLVVYEEAEK